MMQRLLTWVTFNPPQGHCAHFPPLIQTHGCIGGWLRLFFSISPTLAAFPVSLWRCSRFTDGAMWRHKASIRRQPSFIDLRTQSHVRAITTAPSLLHPSVSEVMGRFCSGGGNQRAAICWMLLAMRRLIWPPIRSPGHPSFGQWTHQMAPFLDLPDICVIWRHRQLAGSHCADTFASSQLI